ncbi:M42 family peptidase [Leptolyngbya sp. GB1-A1]|uniref:M42 family metallopeptidase n=1 Tax=Leptolyngbya sp. GB1-A1 TaxID=2933908 RepID=UPI00329A7EAC
MSSFDRLFDTITELVLCHSPSGAEQEINDYLLRQFEALGIEAWIDAADNVIAKISAGSTGDSAEAKRSIAITAHKDEIGGIVKSIESDGRLHVRRLGGAYPWVYGEGVVDILGDRSTVSGILSFGSRHVSHESPQKALQEDKPLTWEAAWVETKRSAAELAETGVRPGTRVVIGKHRKQPFRLNDYIASYTLDNKASIAILLSLAETLKQPAMDVYLVASAKEEVGAIGAMYFTQKQSLDALIALEICPLSAEYPIEDGTIPVLLVQDGYGIYDEALNAQLLQAADCQNLSLQMAVLSGFGSDGSIAMKFGHVPRAACLSFPTQNTHGYEIAHLGAIDHCVAVLRSFCESQR